MPNSTITLVFDDEFEYPENGQMARSNAISLNAPGQNAFDLHNRLASLITIANTKSLGVYGASGMQALRDIQSHAVSEMEASDNQPVAPEPDPVEPTLSDYAMNLNGFKLLGEDEYPKFMKRLKDELSGNATLAVVSGTSVPITDAIWEQIGMKGAEAVIGGFVDFFEV